MDMTSLTQDRRIVFFLGMWFILVVVVCFAGIYRAVTHRGLFDNDYMRSLFVGTKNVKGGDAGAPSTQQDVPGQAPQTVPGSATANKVPGSATANTISDFAGMVLEIVVHTEACHHCQELCHGKGRPYLDSFIANMKNLNIDAMVMDMANKSKADIEAFIQTMDQDLQFVPALVLKKDNTRLIIEDDDLSGCLHRGGDISDKSIANLKDLLTRAAGTSSSTAASGTPSSTAASGEPGGNNPPAQQVNLVRPAGNNAPGSGNVQAHGPVSVPIEEQDSGLEPKGTTNARKGASVMFSSSQ